MSNFETLKRDDHRISTIRLFFTQLLRREALNRYKKQPSFENLTVEIYEKVWNLRVEYRKVSQNLMVNILWKIRFESTNHDLRILALNSWDKIRFIIFKTIKLNRRLIMNCRVNLGSFESEQSQEFNCLACVIVAVTIFHFSNWRTNTMKMSQWRKS